MEEYKNKVKWRQVRTENIGLINKSEQNLNNWEDTKIQKDKVK